MDLYSVASRTAQIALVPARLNYPLEYPGYRGEPGYSNLILGTLIFTDSTPYTHHRRIRSPCDKRCCLVWNTSSDDNNDDNDNDNHEVTRTTTMMITMRITKRIKMMIKMMITIGIKMRITMMMTMMITMMITMEITMMIT